MSKFQTLLFGSTILFLCPAFANAGGYADTDKTAYPNPAVEAHIDPISQSNTPSHSTVPPFGATNSGHSTPNDFPPMTDFNHRFQDYQSWNGFYMGAHVGGSFSSSDYTNGSDLIDNDMDGFTYGLLVGFDHQFNSPWLVGLEGDFSLSTEEGSKTSGTVKADDDVKWTTRLRGRAGYLINPDALVFAAGGFSYSNRESNVSISTLSYENKDDYSLGWNIGFGAEAKIDNKIRARAEYLYDRYNLDMNAGGVEDKEQSHTIRAALIYDLTN